MPSNVKKMFVFNGKGVNEDGVCDFFCGKFKKSVNTAKKNLSLSNISIS